MIETEVKIRWAREASEARALIERCGYRIIAPRTLEIDQLFDRLPGELKKSDQLLRLRQTTSVEAGSRATVTYKGPATRERYKSREEIEFDISSPDAYLVVLERLGYLPLFRYEKYRTKFAVSSEPGFITLDETPIGVFLELEGPEFWIDLTAARLGFPASLFITASYAALYREYRETHQQAPANMTFDSFTNCSEK